MSVLELIGDLEENPKSPSWTSTRTGLVDCVTERPAANTGPDMSSGWIIECKDDLDVIVGHGAEQRFSGK